MAFRTSFVFHAHKKKIENHFSNDIWTPCLPPPLQGKSNRNVVYVFLICQALYQVGRDREALKQFRTLLRRYPEASESKIPDSEIRKSGIQHGKLFNNSYKTPRFFLHILRIGDDSR